MIAAVPVASMLSFAVQPMMGKRLLPIYGGSAGTWLGAMVFFQLSLLVGYGWATWLLTRTPGFQRRATLVLAAVAIATFRLPALDTQSAAGVGHILWVLSLNALPAMMLLFSVSPLMHGWLQREGDGVPYHIYAVSNAGSLAGLLAYPFFVEPYLPLHTQRWIVHGGIVVVTGLIGVAVALMAQDRRLPDGDRQLPDPETNRQSEIANRKSGLADYAAWIGFSILTCVCMLGATELLAAELGSNPLAWVGPFGAYLLSFTITFSGKWKPWMMVLAVFSLVIGLVSFMFYKGPSSEPLAGPGFYTLIVSVTAASFVGNGFLYRLRPAQRFDRYYLALAAGGVIGGLLVSVVLPHVFARPLEFIAAATLLLLIGLCTVVARREFGAMATIVALVLFPLTGIGYRTLLRESPTGTVRHFRNIYGHIFLRTTTSGNQSRLEVLSESTIHGTQLHVDAISARRPTLYYSESSGVGRVLLQMRAAHPALKVGVVGLGAGTLATYERKEDEFTFWDIDPKAIAIAQTEFSYLKDAAGKTQVVQADGRKGLAQSAEDFDLLVIDAFSGDGVPAHLVTVEALEIYLARLKAKNGFLVIHTSSRYGEIYPVVAASVRKLGRDSMQVVTQMSQRGQNIDWDPADTEYILIPPKELMRVVESWFPLEEDNGRVKRQLVVDDTPGLNESLVWTDERHAAIQAIDLQRFLFWRNP